MAYKIKTTTWKKHKAWYRVGINRVIIEEPIEQGRYVYVMYKCKFDKAGRIKIDSQDDKSVLHVSRTLPKALLRLSVLKRKAPLVLQHEEVEELVKQLRYVKQSQEEVLELLVGHTDIDSTIIQYNINNNHNWISEFTKTLKTWLVGNK